MQNISRVEINHAHFLFAVRYAVHIYRYIKEWRKNPQLSFGCCLALLLPLNDMQSEILGSAGRNVVKQQLATGAIDIPSMSSALKDSGAIDFELKEDEINQTEETNDGKATTTDERKGIEQGVLTLAMVSIHDLPKKRNQKAL